jgi:uncharacterized membrane protein
VLAAALTGAAVLWVAVIVAAPRMASRGRLAWVTVVIYQLGSLICHQRPERSFHLAGLQMPVCARCFGLYAAGAAGLLVAWVVRRTWTAAQVRLALVVAALPIALSVALESMGTITTSNVFRTATGVPLGFVAGLVIVGLLCPSSSRARFS